MMLERAGRIVNMSSIVGSTGYRALSAYAATKAALRSFTRSLAAELVGRGIRVNAVSPGPIETPAGFERSGLSKEAMEEFAKNIVAQVPMKRFGEPEEIGELVLFVCSDACGFMTADTIYVNGGGGWR